MTTLIAGYAAREHVNIIFRTRSPVFHPDRLREKDVVFKVNMMMQIKSQAVKRRVQLSV
jgi:hypothetical protein